ncbi:MAG: vitamin B12 dependent-methionine synthase activation domain-containing protein [Prevotellaceae bacterium]|nr:vitamin B12 dependent-methionine synthase activation domain-containing protein [Prevotellaceae bacterium]
MERYRLTYRLSEVAPYINWPYFYHAWQVKDQGEQLRLRQQAEKRIATAEDKYATHALFALADANGDGDDIVFDSFRIPLLRQQKTVDDGTPNLCLSDFLRPLEQGIADKLGIFATTVDIGLETDFGSDDFERLMHQLIADRLAEATAERMHQEVRTRYWGYAPDEHLTMQQLHSEQFQGIRPAVGYPSLPDASINFVLDGILHFGDIGIRLTESGAMKPHASVSGLMMAHPQARYFSIGTVGDDQLADYAQRRGVPLKLIRKFI